MHTGPIPAGGLIANFPETLDHIPYWVLFLGPDIFICSELELTTTGGAFTEGGKIFTTYPNQGS